MINFKRAGKISNYQRSPLDDFSWLVSLIRELRPDLCKIFRTKDAVSLEFAKWLLGAGRKEYASLYESEELRSVFTSRLKVLGMSPLEGLIYMERPDVRRVFPLPEKKNGFMEWFYRHGVDEHGLLPILDNDGRKRYFQVHPDKEYHFVPVEKPKTGSAKSFGVNLIGYAYGQLGIGEDLRMTARALQLVNVPFTIINFPPGNNIPQNDMTMAEYVGTDAPYMFNLFCLTALETGRFYVEKGEAIFNDHYNIGYWPWELSEWPKEWRQLTDLVDEAWVSSRHIYDALSPVSPVPVLIMPLAVEVGEISNLGRKDFKLPEDAYLFCFSFDLNSSIHRKNPQACLMAFQKAFPKGEATDRPVGLVIKCHRPRQNNEYWEKLKKAAKNDARIHIIEGTLSRPDLMALYKCCDCYLSLHRAEGFGRGIAEALLLGLEVIATGYSGNLDFCNMSSRSHLVNYKLIPVNKDQYPYWQGNRWADPDLNHAAMLMQEFVNQSDKTCSKEKFLFEIKNSGKNYYIRLCYLWSNINNLTHI